MNYEERLLKIILSPHLTNKTCDLSDKSSYVVFKVLPDSKKSEVKAAVEKLFEVSVLKVHTLNFKGKFRRSGKIEGRRKDWKKAYVKLADGHNINFSGSET